MKKTLSLTALTLALATSSAFAAAPATTSTTPSIRSGFLIGVEGGYSMMRGKVDGIFDTDGPIPGGEPPIPAARQISKKASTFVGDVLMGARYVFKNGITLGGDVSLGYDGNHISSPLTYNDPLAGTTEFGNKLKRTYFITPSFIVGKTFTPRLHGFIKLGLGVSKFKNEIKNIAVNRTFRSSKTTIGFVPTIGLEYALTQRISLTGSLSYERYGDLKKKYVNVVSNANPTAEYTSRIRKVNFFTAKAGVTFHF